jgi:hypothetical protein
MPHSKSIPRGNLLAMPLVLVNLGAEMLFVLDQRLQAQAVAPDKASRVITETVCSMLNPATLSAFLEPEDVFSQRSARRVFDKLAHSSIMRLNKPSMDKLYDLMTMAWKYQLLQSVGPRALLDITYRHLEQLRALVGGSVEATKAVDAASTVIAATYATLPLGELAALRRAVFRFVQDRHVKVSLFLAEGRKLQMPDATIVLDGFDLLPPGTEASGTVRYFDASGKVTGTQKLPPLVELATASTGQADRLTFPLGCNIYAKCKQRGGSAATTEDLLGSKNEDVKEVKGIASPVAAAEPTGMVNARLLSAMLRVGADDASGDGGFILHIGPAAGTGEEEASVAISFDGTEGRVDIAALTARLGLEDGPSTAAQLAAGGAPASDEDDLLALLDAV